MMKKKAKAKPKSTTRAKPARKAARRKATLKPLPPPGTGAGTMPAILGRLAAIERLLKQLLHKFGTVSVKSSEAPVQMILLDENGNASHSPVLDKSDGDRVCWHNNGDIDRTLKFTGWPFVGAKEEIAVPAGASSSIYMPLYDSLGSGYNYTIDPIPTEEGGPPGGPEVITDD